MHVDLKLGLEELAVTAEAVRRELLREHIRAAAGSALREHIRAAACSAPSPAEKRREAALRTALGRLTEAMEQFEEGARGG